MWRTYKTRFIVQVAGWLAGAVFVHVFSPFLPCCCIVPVSADNVFCQLQSIFLTTNSAIAVTGIQTPPHFFFMCIPFSIRLFNQYRLLPFWSQTNNITNYKTSTIQYMCGAYVHSMHHEQLKKVSKKIQMQRAAKHGTASLHRIQIQTHATYTKRSK